MQNYIVLSLLASILVVSCGVKKSTKAESMNNETRQKLTNLFSKNGFKCLFTSSDGMAKDIFISEELKDGVSSISLHDYRENGKINFIGASLKGVFFSKINLKKAMVGEYEVRQGTTALISSSRENLTQEDKVISTTGRLTLTNEMFGVVEQVNQIMKEDQTTTTKYEELGRIQNCAESSAHWG